MLGLTSHNPVYHEIKITKSLVLSSPYLIKSFLPPLSTVVLQVILLCYTACAFDIRLYLTPLGQARQFIETRNLWYIKSPLWTKICLFLG